mmetsp:Transcript_92938/g.248726  ORF Transcript_92938/g.248726 Transcript_92938/m.248726 type:complete len:204 (+) Transcript_92938:414-1025(+)
MRKDVQGPPRAVRAHLQHAVPASSGGRRLQRRRPDPRRQAARGHGRPADQLLLPPVGAGRGRRRQLGVHGAGGGGAGAVPADLRDVLQGLPGPSCGSATGAVQRAAGRGVLRPGAVVGYGWRGVQGGGLRAAGAAVPEELRQLRCDWQDARAGRGPLRGPGPHPKRSATGSHAVGGSHILRDAGRRCGGREHDPGGRVQGGRR